MKSATWILVAVGGLVAWAMLSKKDTTNVVVQAPATAQGAPEKEPFGSPPKDDGSWIEDIRMGVGAAKDVYDMVESAGIFGNAKWEFNW